MSAKSFVAVLISAPLAAFAQGDTSGILVQNLTHFGSGAIRDYLSENLSVEQVRYLEKGKNAVMVWEGDFTLPSGENYCWTIMGLTEPPRDGLNPRFPSSTYDGVYRSERVGKMTADERHQCLTESFYTAVNFISGTAVGELSTYPEKVLPTGNRTKKGRDTTRARLFSVGLDEEGRAAVAGAIPRAFTESFDDRQVEVVVNASSVKVGERLVCLAAAGIAATPPTDRHPRVPAFTQARALTVRPELTRRRGVEAQCREEAAVGAVTQLMALPYDDTGLLQGFSWAREEDLPLPKPVKVKGNPAAASARQVSRVQHTTTCQTRCVNGDCVREWPDGRKERFQAQRRFNPLNSQWEWDSGGC